MATLEQKINTLKEQAAKRRIAKFKHERPTTPKGQAELDFSGTLEDTRAPEEVSHYPKPRQCTRWIRPKCKINS